jgi:acetyl-CoA synthetase
MSDIYPVNPAFAARTRIDRAAYERDYRASVDDPDAFWGRAAQRLDWFRAPTRVRDVSFALEDFRIR